MKLKTFVKEFYNKKKQKNKKYSLRSFAKDLEIPVSRLSEVMSGKSGFSEERVINIAQKLKLTKEETFFFTNLNLSEFARSKKNKVSAKLKLAKYNYKCIPEDIFAIISDWYHFAILELTRTKDFKSDVNYISNRLSISKEETEIAIDRLFRNKFLIRDKNNNFFDNFESLITPDEIPSSAVRKSHKQILTKAIDAIEEQALDNRDFNAHIAAFSKKDMKKLKKIIEQFMSQASNKMNSNNIKDSVYCLSVNFFELTK